MLKQNEDNTPAEQPGADQSLTLETSQQPDVGADKARPKSQVEIYAEALVDKTADLAPLPELELGKRYLYRAVHGLLINPHTEDRFDTDALKPANHDAWLDMQYKARKIVIDP